MLDTDKALMPFFSRAYGGYTNAQEEFFLDALGSVKGKTIFDPMAGQAFSLSNLAHQGATVLLGDLDPAPLLLALLRDPSVMKKAAELSGELLNVIDKIPIPRKKMASPDRFVEDWVSPEIATGLTKYAGLVGLGLFANPYATESEFWTGDEFTRFATAIAVLAARSLTCYRSTGNLTWLKPGGLLREAHIHRPLSQALQLWKDYCSSCLSDSGGSTAFNGSVRIHPMNVEHGTFGNVPKVPWIITSPPYANRLDYSRLWGPEISVLASMCNASLDRLRVEQIGSNVVGDPTVSRDDESLLPKVVLKALRAIRDDTANYSKVYYYPFFRNYAVSLVRALTNTAKRLAAGGKLLIFVRDTVRKDVLFPTGELVRAILTSKECGLSCIQEEKKIIRHHIGFLRKASTRGVYGLAQVEWWQAFVRPRGDTNGRSR